MRITVITVEINVFYTPADTGECGASRLCIADVAAMCILGSFRLIALAVTRTVVIIIVPIVIVGEGGRGGQQGKGGKGGNQMMFVFRRFSFSVAPCVGVMLSAVVYGKGHDKPNGLA